MKKTIEFISHSPLFALILTACGNDDNKKKMVRLLSILQFIHLNLLQNKLVVNM